MAEGRGRRPGRWLVRPAEGRVDVDLDDVEIDRGADVVELVNALRDAGSEGRRVVVRGCPQLLAHTLYKAGILREGWLELASVREEEPYG